MNYALLCRRVIFFTVVAVLLFDLYLYAFGGVGSTITVQLWGMTTAQLVAGTLTFGFGYLAGHIFGRIDK